MARPKSNAKPPQTMNEMIANGEDSKKSSRLYKAQSVAITNDRISDTVTNTVEELRQIMNREPITLADVKSVKACTLSYFDSCSRTSTIPSFSGLARALGVSRNALYDFMKNNPTGRTTKWLEIARDAMSDVLAESSLRNDTNTIASIFLQKALYGMRDTHTIEIDSKAETPLNRLPSIDDVMSRYTDNELSEEEKEIMLAALPKQKY